MAITTVKTSGKPGKSAFRKVSEWLHLWLGLGSGVIVFVVCLTGALWVFRYEVWYFTEKSYQRVEPRSTPRLAPSVLASKSRKYLATKVDSAVTLTAITYYGRRDRSASCTFSLPGKKSAMIYLDPYTGAILKDKREPSAAEKFFIFVRAGHRFFWLPQKIGSPVVGSACLVFLVIMITGLIWWYPAKWTKKTREKSFKIKWNARWKRLNIDLHNVLGFYSLLFVMVLTISGIVFTFDWFEHSVYRALTWKEKKEDTSPLSDTTGKATQFRQPEDILWRRTLEQYGRTFGRIVLEPSVKPEDPYEVAVFFGDGTIIYNSKIRYYDQKTLRELKGTSLRATSYATLSTGEKVFRMNFDIHTGQILGLPTKILAFLACIIGASLPVTGVIIWYNRKWGKKKRQQEA